MKQGKETLKARLLAQYEAELEQMLKQVDEKEEMKLGEIEGLALRTRTAVGQAITQALAEEAMEVPVELPGCPGCHQAMHYKGKKRRVVVTLTGEIRVDRPNYYCQACRQGLFPPG
jgi:hypothetical protein